MCAVLIGGMDRLCQDYIETARNLGIELKVFTGQGRSLKNRLGTVDMVILFTGAISHSAKNEALQHAKTNNIPVHMLHSSGISSLRRCIAAI